ncbi:MAG: hypothetical protein RL285_172 [Bacteroidota bacterium]
MKHSIKYFYFLIITGLLVAQGCQIQQRRYTGGLSIQWPSLNTKNAKAVHPNNAGNESQIAIRPSKNEASVTASSDFPESTVSRSVEIKDQTIDSENRINEHDLNPSAELKKTGHQPTLNQNSNKSNTHLRKQLKQQRKQLPEGPVVTMFIVLGVICMVINYINHSWGDGGLGSGWALVYSLLGSTASSIGLLSTIALKSTMSATGLHNMLLLFTVIGGIFNALGLIKSIRDMYDTGIYISIAGFLMLAAMWIITLI